MKSLKFKGCGAYRIRYNNHDIGVVKEYSDGQADKLLKFMPDGFDLVGAQNDTPKPKFDIVEDEVKEDTKEVIENKMVESAPENKVVEAPRKTSRQGFNRKKK